MAGTKIMELGYWDFRGYGEACRYMLEYCECDYDDKQYPRRSRVDYSAWRDICETLDLDFPNLPYLIDGTKRLTESVAILKYLGRKYGLTPGSEDDKIRADMVEGVVLEIRDRFYGLFFEPEGQYSKYVHDFITDMRGLHAKLKKIIKFMGKNKWLVNNELTYVDFLFYAMIAQIRSLIPKALDGYDRIDKYMIDFQSIPTIKSYLKSGRFAEFPDHDPYLRLDNKVDSSFTKQED
ncbi:glutathione S-transferase Mu 2-like isoform X1 [Styela clava]